MNNIIEVYNLNYKKILNNINLNIKEGAIINLVGRNSSGKTTLMKILSGLLITENEVKIDSVKINKFNIDNINKKVSLISSNNEYFSKTVLEEILQDKMQININDINKVKKYLNDFNVPYLVDMSPLDLSYAENQIVSIIKFIIKKPKILFIDNAFCRFDIDKKNELLNYITKYCKENGITLIYTTTNLNDYMFSDEIIILNHGKIYLELTKENILKEEKKINQINLKLPFLNELSNKLKMYNLLDKNYDDLDKLVIDLCD